ncbi:MAG: tRNA dihydrouridine synthase DusB [Burkholderiales bacterium]|nr:tRNA dihydrouridine synthase DusB [Burkholderiales bacterium]
MQIGPFHLRNNLVLAPMAGVTDRPFRQLCKRLGAGMAVSEMTTSQPHLWDTAKSRRRRDHSGEDEPVSVQIAGADPSMMAAAARHNVEHGARIIDINMGCPARKVCNVMAGSALLRDEALVGRILDAVVAAVDVPVTLKIRTGWDAHGRNAVTIARLAEQAGIRALAVHGRTRACGFGGSAEYATIAEVKSRVRIPVIANGDIATPEQARHVLDTTGADGLMIGRAAQGRPWIFRDIEHYLRTGQHPAPAGWGEIAVILTGHLEQLYRFYGEETGVRVARKHVGWYLKASDVPHATLLRTRVNAADSADAQTRGIARHFARLEARAEAAGAIGEALVA